MEGRIVGRNIRERKSDIAKIRLLLNSPDNRRLAPL